jgi:polar amino acid transport system substrate-binding protein
MVSLCRFRLAGPGISGRSTFPFGMIGVKPLVILAVLLAMIRVGSACAQTAPAPLSTSAPIKVGVIVAPPFVTHVPGGYGGMAIDLWQDIAEKLGISYQYEELPTLKALLAAVADGHVDLAVTDITITRDRLQRMDFTQPWFDTGLRIMIDQNRHVGFWGIVKRLWVSGHVAVYLWMLALILAATVILTAIDRRFDEEFPREWKKGLADSFYHVMSIATSGKSPTHKQMFGVFGRVMAGVWMVCGIGVIAYVTSSVTSVMTAATIANQINSTADLPGKTVGVVEGGVAESYGLDAALSVQNYPTLTMAVRGLLKNQVAAVIDDAPILEFYDNNHPELPLTEVGAIFRPSKYGFAAPRGSALVRPISVAIVEEEEDGFLERLHGKYFGVEP